MHRSDRTAPRFASPDHADCWHRIRAHVGSGQGHALDLVDVLVRKFRWDRAYAEAAVEEYRRFCFLAATDDTGVTPSAEVDEVWHLHLQHTRDYWEHFCPRVLRMDLHHEPGGRSRGRDRVFRAQYAETLARYQAVFGPPPEAFWPGMVARFGASPRFLTVDAHRVWVVPRWRIEASRRVALTIGIALAALMLAPAALALAANPLDWDGPTFLKLYLVLLAAALAGGLFVRRGPDEEGTATHTGLSPYEAAYLAGGTARVVDAATADLMARGAAHWDASRQLLQVSSTTGLPAPADAIARAFQATPDLRQAAPRIEAAVAPLVQGLRMRRLLLDAQEGRARARRSALPALLVFGLGLAKVGVGIARDRPVGYLVILSFAALVMSVLFLRANLRVTAAGRRALRRARRDHAAAMRAPRGQDVAIAVALVGTSVLAGTAYAAYHDWRQPPGSSDSGGSFSSDSSGSSSSDSSDSGGGSSGCGGCGGCGGGGD